MRRLRIDQPVTVSLDDLSESISCRVLSVQGSVGRLAFRDELPPPVVGRLAVGSAGYLVFDQFRNPIGLRVAVRARPPYLDAAVIDGVTLPERRRSERVRLVTPVRIAGPGELDRDPPAQWTETVNLSERGALLRSHAALAGRRECDLELSFGTDPQPIAARAQVARRTSDAVGVVFESISAADATRLGEYLMGLRHQRGPASNN